jgi:hypothetical protein
MKRTHDELAQEVEQTTERLRHSERMASLGTLAAGLGHDLGNLLLPLDVRLQFLLGATSRRSSASTSPGSRSAPSTFSGWRTAFGSSPWTTARPR